MSDPRSIGRYEILSELGRGAMGSVFLARDPAMDRTVAVKTILSVALASEQGSEFRERFYREARAAGGLAHPGIVPVFDVGEHEGVPFLVMEYVNGQTLASVLKNGQRATLDRACEIAQQIADALGYAHRHGVVHRDIKPANILMTARDTYGSERPRITDFGVAKLISGEITKTGQLLGTPEFMPPEQFTGQPIDGRTDLFSLGVILYWMAAGEHPFPGETVVAVSYKVVHTEPIPPARLNPAIPKRLEHVILKCLAKSPTERYQSGEELAQELAAVRANTTATSLHTDMPTLSLGGDTSATIDSNPNLLLPKQEPASAIAPPTPAPASTGPAPRTRRPPSLSGAIVVGAVVLVLVVSMNWFLLRNHKQVVIIRQEPAAAPIAAGPPAVATPAPLPAVTPKPSAALAAPPAAPTTATPKPATAKSAAPTPAVVASKTPAPPKAAPGHPHASGVGFDPKTLDAKLNGKLKLDLSKVPPALAFTLEMNGKLYFEGTAGNKAAYDTLFVLPGVQEFRVIVSGGGVQKISNVASADFRAKKGETLKVELRTATKTPADTPPGTSPATPPALSPDAQVIATLKDSSFFSR